MGETECGNPSPLLSKKGSKLGKTAELACLWFRGVRGAGLVGCAAVLRMDSVVSTGTFFALGLRPGL